jgi:ABC-type sulfate transport system permease subunit
MADAPVLVLLIAAVGAHLALVALGLVFFGAEGYRTSAIITGSFRLGPMSITYQSLLVVGATVALLAALAASRPEALSVAFLHTLFNVSGIVLPTDYFTFPFVAGTASPRRGIR